MSRKQQVTALMFAAVLLVGMGWGCSRVQDSGEEYVPISQAPIQTESYVFSSVDTASEEAARAALGEFWVAYNESTTIQRVYLTDAAGATATVCELPAGEHYECGPLSPDGNKLFLYRKDPESTADNDRYYGVVVDLTTGLTTVSPMPYFDVGTVCWAGNDRLFTANRQIVFFSAQDFGVTTAHFDIITLIENDPEGKYILTGMVYDRTRDRYIASYGEKVAGADTLEDYYRTKQGLAVIDSLGRTEQMFLIGDGVYAPTDGVTGSPLPQTLQVDSGNNVALYSVFFESGSDEPTTEWIVVDTVSQAKVSLPYRMRDGLIRGGWIYGLCLTPYSNWWNTMSIDIFTPDSTGKYSLQSVAFTQSSDSRYVAMDGTKSDNSYELFSYPDGSLLLKAYHTESGNTRLVLTKIDLVSGAATVVGALPGRSSMQYMIAGVDLSGRVVYLSDT